MKKLIILFLIMTSFLQAQSLWKVVNNKLVPKNSAWSIDTSSFKAATVRSQISSTATGLTYTNTSGIFSLTNGYVIPTQASLDLKAPLISPSFTTPALGKAHADSLGTKKLKIGINGVVIDSTKNVVDTLYIYSGGKRFKMVKGSFEGIWILLLMGILPFTNKRFRI